MPVRARLVVLGRLVAAAALLAALGCAKSEPTPPVPTGPAVVNTDLGIALAEVPAGFSVKTNQGDQLVLVPVNPATPGQVEFEVGPEETGVNLVAAVKHHQAEVEAEPGATYEGARELVGPLGSAFWSRAKVGDQEVVKLFTIHPSGNRLLTITYSYPAAGDSGQRVQQALDVLAEVEGIPGPDAAAEPTPAEG